MTDLAVRVDYAEEPDLGADEFLRLAQAVWHRDYSGQAANAALRATINITARVRGELVGSVRILTDGYFLGTIPEIMVHPDHRRRGIGRRLMELAWERSPTGLYFGAQPGNEPFFERLGYQRSMTSFARRKPRPGESETP